jgi:predicted permease
MTRALLSLLLIPSGILLGWVLERRFKHLGSYPPKLQKLALLGLNPIAFSTSIWALRLSESGAAILPFIGIGVLAFGFFSGQLSSRLLHLDRDRSTILSLSSGTTNIGSIGAIVVFILLGESGFALIPFYKVFEELWYYGVCFPFSARAGSLKGESRNLSTLLKDPFLAVSFASIALGLALNFSGIPRPAFFKTLNAWIVPAATFLLLVAIGMKIPKRQKPIPRPILASFLGIRLLLIPAFSLGIAVLTGLHMLPDNTAFLVTVILSFMPTAFISLVPPSLYGLDFELSFGLWLVSNISLAGVLPLLWFLTSHI